MVSGEEIFSVSLPIHSLWDHGDRFKEYKGVGDTRGAVGVGEVVRKLRSFPRLSRAETLGLERVCNYIRASSITILFYWRS